MRVYEWPGHVLWSLSCKDVGYSHCLIPHVAVLALQALKAIILHPSLIPRH